MARHRFVTLMVAGVLAATGLAACGGGGSGGGPEAVHSALQNTANQAGLQLTLSFSGNQSAFQNGQSTLTPAQEQAILDSSLVLQVRAADGTNLSNAGNGGQVALALEHGSNTLNNPLAELRVVGSTLYGRVDLSQLTGTYGLDKGRVAQFRSQLDQLGSRVSGLSALNAGRWVSVDINQLNTLTQTAGITLPSAPQLVARLVSAFFNALNRSQNVTSLKDGKAQITAGAQTVVTGLAQAIQNAPGMSSFGSQINGLADRAKASVPANANANVTVSVSNGMVSGLELPLNQFRTAHPLKGPVSVKLAVATTGAVSAPSGATPLSLPQLIRALQSNSGSS